MNIYLFCTTNLGDFLNGFPVISGISKAVNERVNFVIPRGMRKVKGVKEFFLHQPMFESVHFDDEQIPFKIDIHLSSWTRRDKGNLLRPIETCRYENWIRDRAPKFDFLVDDDFELTVPDLGIPISDTFYIGDRWSKSPDPRKAPDSWLSHIKEGEFLSFDNDLTTNAYLIKNSPYPFMSCLTGVGILADLMKKETVIVWKPEDFAPEFRRGDDVWFADMDIAEIFDCHYYRDRKAKLVHDRDVAQMIHYFKTKIKIT